MTQLAWEAFQLLLWSERETLVPIQGTSMHPYLKQGDRLRLVPARAEELGLGDLMAFRRGDELVVHRMAGRVRREEVSCLRQKGDNLRGFSLVRPEEVLGRVSHVLRGDRELDLARPSERLGNRVRGLRAWAFCAGFELGSRVWHALRGGGAR